MSSLTCTISKGDFPLEIIWSLNNDSAETVPGISVMRTNKRISQLSIDSVQAQHAGIYTCSAKNPAGISHQAAVLHVNGTIFFCLLFSFTPYYPIQF